MCWYGCLRQWKHPFNVDQIVWRIWKSTRTRTSRKFTAYSKSHRNWFLIFFERFCLWIRFTALLHPGRDRYCLMIKWSSRLKQKYLSTLIPYCDWWKWMRADVLLKDWKVKWRKSRCPLLTKIRQESMENKLNSSWIFHRVYIIADSTRDSEYLQERNIKSQEFTDRITFMSMFNDIDWRGKTIRFREVKTHAKKFLQGHWTFFSPGDDKRLYGEAKYLLEEESDSVSGGTATQGNRSSRVHKRQCIESWNSENAERKRNHNGAVSNGCEQHGLTEEGKEQERPLGRKESVSNGVLSSLFLKKLFLLGIFPKTCICLRKHTQDFEALSETKSVHKVMRRCNFSASGRIWYELEKSDLTRTTVLDSWFHWAGKVRFSRVIHQPRALAAIPGGPIIGPVIEVQIVKFLTNMDLKLPFHA